MLIKSDLPIILLYIDTECNTWSYGTMKYQGIILRYYDSKKEYVTHTFCFESFDEKPKYFHGHYFTNILSATEDYQERVAKHIHGRISVSAYRRKNNAD